MLTKIKTLLGLTDTSKDVLLNLLIDIASDEARAYIHDDDISGLDDAVIQMVIFKYNRIGTEGLNSEGYSGVTFGYSSDYPEAIIRSLRAKRKIRTC